MSDKFSYWFRHEMNDCDFLWTVFMLAMTDGLWIIPMIIYYAIKAKKESKQK